MHSFKQIIAGALLLLAAVQAIEAQTDSFLCQTITLPAKSMHTQFADLNGRGRFDLLAVDSVGKRLLIYRQRADGFTSAPDQILELPPDTAWIAPARVEATVDDASSARSARAGTAVAAPLAMRAVPTTKDGRANFDLLVSTATGLVYYRQDNGAFEAKPCLLFKANQIFTGDNSPTLFAAFTNAAIPVISDAQAWLYRRNEQLEWTSGPPMLLRAEHGNWSGSRNGWSGWSVGPNAARTLRVERRYLSRPEQSVNYTPENDGIARLIATLKKTAAPGMPPETTQVDLEGDGRKDLVVWQVTVQSYRTDFYIFLRSADGRLSELPTQILHCRGTPISINSAWTPIADLKNDGKYELVLLEPDFIVTSIGGLVDLALTRGVKLAITVRSFSHGAFARTAETAVSFKALFSVYGSWEWPFLICGDFNGDGRPDLLVKRSATQWEIYYSTGEGRWFEPQPGMTFELPGQSYFERRYFDVIDLNGDGRSDIVSHDLDDARIFIFLTQPENPKGNP